MERKMSAHEMERWAAFEVVEPFLPQRIDLAAALICTVTANIHRGKGAPAYELADFMPVLKMSEADLQVEQTRQRLGLPEPVDEDDAMLQRMVAAYG